MAGLSGTVFDGVARFVILGNLAGGGFDVVDVLAEGVRNLGLRFAVFPCALLKVFV